MIAAESRRNYSKYPSFGEILKNANPSQFSLKNVISKKKKKVAVHATFSSQLIELSNFFTNKEDKKEKWGSIVIW